MIKYLGSKRTLVDAIVDVVRQVPKTRVVLDLFSGTSRVGHALKAQGYQVLANDHNAYAHTLAMCYVQADRETLVKDVERLMGELSKLKGKAGYFTENYCIQSRYFQPHNGERIDAIREAIAKKKLPAELEAVLLVSLMEAADRVDSTTGVQMAYLKTWAARSYNTLEMRVPQILPQAKFGKGAAHRLDALEAAQTLEVDVAYIDPPYNQHSYLGNYHIWESLVCWDKPEVYGVARKRWDCKTRQSRFNSKRQFRDTFAHLIQSVRAKTFVVSFNNEGYLDQEDLLAILGARGEVSVLEYDYKRYVGAQIGIYNLDGKKVGKVSHLRNKEFLFVVRNCN